MNLIPLAWQSLTLEYPFKACEQAVHFFDFQPLTKQAIDQFKLAQAGSLLILKSETLPEFISEITGYFARDYASPLITKTHFNAQQLFGSAIYLEKTQEIKQISGAIAQANNGILILNLTALLADLSQWDQLKHALLFGAYLPYQEKIIPEELTEISAQFKLVLIGSREEIAVLNQYDENLYQIAQYSEVQSYFSIDENHFSLWGNYFQTMAKKWLNKTFSQNAINQYLQNAIRESESQQLISISPTLLKKHLYGIANFYPNQPAFNDINGYFQSLEKQSAVLSQYALQDILNEQIYIATEDEEIGQINGLSVIEFEGVPHSFGEPLRISCNVQYGDGEITDIERKVELGGNLHSKGIIIAQSCLANLLELPTQLPFSASIAFEQSYGEVDGDSSSLAIFCALVSSLAKLPLPQSIAVTGAIDQFGHVLSVGGVNQKIEGFFDLCSARKLTDKQGVIIPSACLSHLSLKSAVIEAVKAKKFRIWAVDDVFETLEILLERVFFEEENTSENTKTALFNVIHQHLEQGQEKEASGSIFSKFAMWWHNAKP